MRKVIAGRSEKSVGAAAFHASRILRAIGGEVEGLEKKIYRRLQEKLKEKGINLRPEPCGDGTTRKGHKDTLVMIPYVTGRLFDISIRHAVDLPSSSGFVGTVTLVFNFYSPNSPTEASEEALLFVCWMPRKPEDDNRWSERSFLRDELTQLQQHPSGLAGYQEMPNDTPVRSQGVDWAYAVRLDDLCARDSFEFLVVDPVIALLSGQTPTEALGTIREKLIRFGQSIPDAARI